MKKISVEHSYIWQLLKCKIWRLFMKLLIFFSSDRMTILAIFSYDRLANFAVSSCKINEICNFFPASNWKIKKFISYDPLTNFTMLSWNQWMNFVIFSRDKIDKLMTIFSWIIYVHNSFLWPTEKFRDPCPTTDWQISYFFSVTDITIFFFFVTDWKNFPLTDEFCNIFPQPNWWTS